MAFCMKQKWIKYNSYGDSMLLQYVQNDPQDVSFMQKMQNTSENKAKARPKQALV